MQQDRIPALPPSKLSSAQKDAHELAEEVLSKSLGPINKVFRSQDSNGAFIGPVATFVQYPTLSKPYLDLLSATATLTKLSPDVKETVILAVGGVHQAAYEMYAHENVAQAQTNLSKEQIETLKKGLKPEGLDEGSDVAWDVANALAGQKGPLDQTVWDRAIKILGQDALVSIIGYIGIYAYTCILLNAVNARVPG